MSESGEMEDGTQRQAKEHPEQADPAERKISDLLGMDSKPQETSRENPNTPPQDPSDEDQDQHS
jgi:hypothetical protein